MLEGWATRPVLTMPATNTGLLLMDPYLTPRSFSTPLTLVALVFLLRCRYVCATLAILCAAAFHLQMGAYRVQDSRYLGSRTEVGGH
jgi:hypothetical protein